MAGVRLRDLQGDIDKRIALNFGWVYVNYDALMTFIENPSQHLS
jgi:hypothetical protein